MLNHHLGVKPVPFYQGGKRQQHQDGGSLAGFGDSESAPVKQVQFRQVRGFKDGLEKPHPVTEAPTVIQSYQAFSDRLPIEQFKTRLFVGKHFGVRYPFSGLEGVPDAIEFGPGEGVSRKYCLAIFFVTQVFALG